MDLRQIEYFVASADEKSFLKASKKLFTSQPNISKSIGKLEKELGVLLFKRVGNGVLLTTEGERFYHYSKNILQQIEIMKDFSSNKDKENFSVCSYPSNMVAKNLVDLYMEYDENLHIKYNEGTVQEIINLVSSGAFDMGIVYVARNQTDIFEHILSHKNLEFVVLKQKNLCVYAGENSPVYNRESISIEELSGLKFARGLSDSFSIEHHLSEVNFSALKFSQLNDMVLTNSDHFIINLLEKTGLCYLSIDFTIPEAEQYKIKMINIDNSKNFLSLGYIKHKKYILSELQNKFINSLKEKL